MPSKLITDRQKSALAVVKAGETHASAIGDAFAKRYTAFLKKPEKMPDVALLIQLVTRALRADTEAMVVADDAHEAELADDAAPRTDRETATDALRARLITFRGAIAGGYGPDAEKKAGFVGEIPKDPVVLGRFGRGVVTSLARLKLPKPLVDGIQIDPKALAKQLEKLLSDLEGHVEDVAREAREAQVTLSAKNQTTDVYDIHFGGASRLLEGALVIAGKPDLADKVRPSSRRPGTTASGDTTGTPPLATAVGESAAPVVEKAAAGGDKPAK